MDNNRMMVFPFSRNTCPLARHQALLNTTLSAICSYSGSGLVGKDVAEIDGGAGTGLTVTGDFEEALKACDSVLFDYDNKIPDVLPAYIQLAVRQGKRVFISEDIIKNILIEDSVVRECSVLRRIDSCGGEVQRELKKIVVPVITVMGLGQDCQKFDTLLGLKQYFSTQGYKVSLVGCKDYCMFFGGSVLPTLERTSLPDKIYYYNAYLEELVRKESPDILLLESPGGIMPLSSEAHYDFGEMALALSAAAPPDVAILGYYFHQNVCADHLERLKDFCLYRLGVEITAFHASNTKTVLRSELNKEEIFLALSANHVFDSVRSDVEINKKFLVFNSLVEESSAKAYSYMFDQLAENMEVI